MLLPGPEAANTLAVELDDPEADVPLVEHDDLVLVGTLFDHVPQSQKIRGVGEDSLAPGWVTCKRKTFHS